MLSTDQSHLRKYLATLGVALVAGVISLSGLFLKIQDDLLVTKSEMADLTPTARHAIERRQQFIEVATTVLPWFLVMGCSAGVALSAFGLIGWSRRQSVADELEDIARERGRAELRLLTDEERLSKLEDEAATTADEEPAADTSSDASREDQASTPHEASPNLLISDQRRRANELMLLSNESELELALKLEEVLGRTHTIELGVTASHGSVRRMFDIVARPTRPEDPQYLFELKVTRNFTKNYRRILRQAAQFVVEGAAGLSADTVPVVVLVYEDAEVTEAIHAQAEEYAAELAPAFKIRPRFLIRSVAGLRTLSANDIFRALI